MLKANKGCGRNPKENKESLTLAEEALTAFYTTTLEPSNPIDQLES